MDHIIASYIQITRYENINHEIPDSECTKNGEYYQQLAYITNHCIQLNDYECEYNYIDIVLSQKNCSCQMNIMDNNELY